MKLPICKECGSDLFTLSIDEITEYHDAHHREVWSINEGGTQDLIDEDFDGSWNVETLTLKCRQCGNENVVYTDGGVQGDNQELVEWLFDQISN